MDFYLSGTAYNEFLNFVTTKLGLKTQAVGQNEKKKKCGLKLVRLFHKLRRKKKRSRIAKPISKNKESK